MRCSRRARSLRTWPFSCCFLMSLWMRMPETLALWASHPLNKYGTLEGWTHLPECCGIRGSQCQHMLRGTITCEMLQDPVVAKQLSSIVEFCFPSRTAVKASSPTTLSTPTQNHSAKTQHFEQVRKHCCVLKQCINEPSMLQSQCAKPQALNLHKPRIHMLGGLGLLFKAVIIARKHTKTHTLYPTNS